MAVAAATAVKAALKVRTPFLRQGFPIRCLHMHSQALSVQRPCQHKMCLSLAGVHCGTKYDSEELCYASPPKKDDCASCVWKLCSLHKIPRIVVCAQEAAMAAVMATRARAACRVSHTDFLSTPSSGSACYGLHLVAVLVSPELMETLPCRWRLRRRWWWLSW